MTVGGAQLTLLKLAAAFQKRGHHTVAVFLYDKDGLESIWQEHYPFEVFSLGGWKARGGIERIWLLFKGLLRLYRYLYNNKIDILMSFTQHSNLLAIPIAYLTRVKGRIASNRGRIENIPLWVERLHGKMINSSLATCLIVNSPLLIKQAVEIEGVKPHKIRLIYNGIADEIFQNERFKGQRAATRKALGVDETELMLISVGRLTHQKGHAYLLQAMPAILAYQSKAKLFIVGDGPLKGELESLAKQLGIQRAVLFLGTRTDVPYLLAAADIFIHPSVSEGMPNALLEAMAVGLPCVCLSIGCSTGNSTA
jgi:glycosyltransferase involved in cell wall biosynthesis